MMTLRLNLLSPEKQKKFLALTKILFLKEMLELVLFTCAVVATTMLIGWIILANSLNDLAISALAINREYPSVNHEITDINKIISEVAQAGIDFYPLSPALMDIIKSLPKEIKINSLNIDRSNNTIILSGTAKTRNDLLNYQKIISGISWIKNINTPASQLFQKENINFELKGQISGWPALRKMTNSVAGRKINK